MYVCVLSEGPSDILEQIKIVFFLMNLKFFIYFYYL